MVFVPQIIYYSVSYVGRGEAKAQQYPCFWSNAGHDHFKMVSKRIIYFENDVHVL